ncbi:MAG: zinc ribbon domain-containing protein [Deltaproteobacteria bacterium]|jgi:hypothetical protein|nr:zinc ribbon domain-containing protein [Deltaproteobacteria bacterium]
MSEMVDICVSRLAALESGLSEDEARKMMKEGLPALKSWKQS